MRVRVLATGEPEDTMSERVDRDGSPRTWQVSRLQNSFSVNETLHFGNQTLKRFILGRHERDAHA